MTSQTRLAPAAIIAAPSSGSGKTTVTLGLLRHFRNAGLAVSSAKVGPDFIDPQFHALASGRESWNHDPWGICVPETIAANVLATCRRSGLDACGRGDGAFRRSDERAWFHRGCCRAIEVADCPCRRRECPSAIRGRCRTWFSHLSQRRADCRRDFQSGRRTGARRHPPRCDETVENPCVGGHPPSSGNPPSRAAPGACPSLPNMEISREIPRQGGGTDRAAY